MYLIIFFNNHASYIFSPPHSPQNFVNVVVFLSLSLSVLLSAFLLPIFVFHNIFHHPNIDFLLGMKLYLENVVKSTKSSSFIFLYTIDCYPLSLSYLICCVSVCVCICCSHCLAEMIISLLKKNTQKSVENLKGSKLISTHNLLLNYVH